MSDLIRRADALGVIERMKHRLVGKGMTYELLIQMVNDLPSTEPKTGWIPVSERLPEEEGNYLVTFGAFTETINGEKVIFGDIDGSVSEIGYRCYERDIFWHPTAFGWYDLATATPFDKRAIIAWMPKPEPYER